MTSLTLIIPVYNSESNIYELIKKIKIIFHSINFEIILINDNSTDNSHRECLKAYAENDEKITYLKLAKNMGEHNAVMAGLNYADGEWAIIMDDDFQNPPEEALKLYENSIKTDYDVIFCKYKKKKHNIFRNFISKINDLTANFILNKPKNIYLSSFKCINKKLYKQLINYKGSTPYIDGLILQTTSKIGSFESEHSLRVKGSSGYTITKLLKLYSNLFTNFSTMPIHLFSVGGLIISTISGVFALFIFIEKMLRPDIPAGYSSIVALIIFFSGIQLIFLGLIGEYIGKILKKVNNESQYLIELEKKRKIVK